MLGNLDNEVIFKKAFTDKTVFKAFVRDILGIDIEVDKIETEKRFEPKIGTIDFKIDIYAESTDKRVIIEIQKIEYDHHFDRFMHYFFMVIAEQQRKAKQYIPEQTVYVIIVLTAPYKIEDKTGKPLLDEVLLLKLNPRTIAGEERILNDHQMVFLNPNYEDKNTPKQIRDWLDLIYQSVHRHENPILNKENEGIKKAMELIETDGLTRAERTKTINANEAKVVIAKEKVATAVDIARNSITEGFDNELIHRLTGLSIEHIERIRNTDYSRLRKK